MRTTLVRVVLAACALLFAATAPAQEVRYNFDRQARFSTFKTYKWVVLADAPRLDSMRDKQIRTAVETQLATKGLAKKAANEPADLYVTYQAAVNTEKGFSAYSSGPGWGVGPGWYGGWYGGGRWTTGETTTIYVGQLVVDVYDAAQKALIWRGVVSKTIDTDAKPDKQQKNLDKALRKLFENYPPQEKQP